MSEVSNIKSVIVTPPLRGSDSSKRLQDGKTLPPVADAGPVQAPVTDVAVQAKAEQNDEAQQQSLQDALGSMNDFVQNVKRDLQFSVDKELNQTVIKVVDSESGKLIRQIPEDIFLELARKVKESGEFNLLNATG